MAELINWGILGTGNIASIFAKDLKLVPGANLMAVGSRSSDTAKDFGNRFGAERCYSSYADLASDPDVDIIYIATPHTYHFDNTRLCLINNKAVLCEKPFMVNTLQAKEIIELARQKNLFIMEAMWTRFLPLMDVLKKLISSGAIGELMSVQADFCFHNEFDINSRLFNPGLAGGALLDVGVYPVMLAHSFLGKPKSIKAIATIGQSGVDESTGAIFDYDHGKTAIIQSSVSYSSPTEAVLSGTKGYIKVKRRWFEMNSLTVHRIGKDPETIEKPYEGRGFHFEIKEAQRCIKNGEIESPLMPHADTLQVMEILDWIRDKISLKYPFE